MEAIYCPNCGNHVMPNPTGIMENVFFQSQLDTIDISTIPSGTEIPYHCYGCGYSGSIQIP